MIKEKLLNINNLSIEYSVKNTVVKNFNMSVDYSEIIAIVGESGSGKSTLLRSILNILPPGGSISHGEIFFNGRDIFKFSKEQLRNVRGKKIAMIFQDAGESLNPIRKISSQFIEYIRTHIPLSKTEAKAKALHMMGKMRLAEANHIMNSYPFQLSGGMKQRVVIAMAMALEPQLLLADEPTSALDATVQAQVIREMMLLRNNFKTSIIIVTHNMGVASFMADKIGVMKEGRLIEWGNKEKVVSTPQHEYTLKLLHSIPELGGIKVV